MQEILTVIWAAILPHLGELLGLIITALIARAVVALRQWTGVQISQRHADRLSAAIWRGALLALERQLTAERARALVLEYLRETVPDALQAVAPSETALSLRADATIAEVRAGLLR
ncbi:MAG: hypothetical protein JNN06_01395 [Gemmobacter sp.]|uniref:hypothetical protein n=1 Tax=Gemmobacter sp. TaxID=1898957 RepID=UPI001A4C487F|nr:hypothetical protein [Gemmobacter sp.]MBL8560909.1 hypothetical protein [Gemmobacter sp.]